MTTQQFLIKQIKNADWEKELEIIGFDKTYRHKYADKFMFKNLKIYNLSTPQANILKQTALTVGGDCAIHREVITGKIEKSDVILSGSFAQLNKIAKKLKYQPFGLSELADKITAQLVEKRNKTKIIGILNITPNSFSDGGMYNTTERACEHFKQLIAEGADIVDIGAESTKPGAPAVSSGKQLEKIMPVLRFIKQEKYNIPISIDTRNSIVAEECLKNGASIINDVSGLKYDKDMAKIIAKYGGGLILQHSLGNEKNMEEKPNYKNLIDDIFQDLSRQVDYAKSCGIENIIIDAGIGFDKDLEDNFKIINRLEEFYSLGYPVMIGLSRKSLLGLKDADNDERDLYTLALNTLAIEHHIDFIRVHNVKIHRKLMDIYKKDII